MNSRVAGALPSMGADQTWRSRSNATRSEPGEMAGASPAPSDMGVPPANGTVQIATSIGIGEAAGFTGSASSQLELWSPPRT
jgi:hypothetical protein